MLTWVQDTLLDPGGLPSLYYPVILFALQYFVDVIREQQLAEWGLEGANGSPFDEGVCVCTSTQGTRVGAVDINGTWSRERAHLKGRAQKKLVQ